MTSHKQDTPDLSHITERLRPLAVALSSLTLDPANARRHPHRNMEALKASLSKFGQRVPVVFNGRNRVVEKGNGTLEAAIALGWTQIAAVEVDDDPMTAAGFAISRAARRLFSKGVFCSTRPAAQRSPVAFGRAAINAVECFGAPHLAMPLVVTSFAKRDAVGRIKAQVRVIGPITNVVRVEIAAMLIAILAGMIIAGKNGVAPCFVAIAAAAFARFSVAFPVRMRRARLKMRRRAPRGGLRTSCNSFHQALSHFGFLPRSKGASGAVLWHHHSVGTRGGGARGFLCFGAVLQRLAQIGFPFRRIVGTTSGTIARHHAPPRALIIIGLLNLKPLATLGARYIDLPLDAGILTNARAVFAASVRNSTCRGLKGFAAVFTTSLN